MPSLKKKDGHLLKKSGHLTCTCCGTCVLCTSGFKPSYSLDFGAAGLTDAGCNYCDQIAGEFIIGGLANCCAEYQGGVVCTWPGACESIKTFCFRILLCVVDAGGGLLQWRADIILQPCVNQDPSCPNQNVSAHYRSATFDPGDCGVVPVTMNRFSQSVTSGVCGGSYPATITLDET